MDERIGRFKYCDPRLYPYLEKVLSRLPRTLLDEILDNEAFQIIADPSLPDICGHCFNFDRPVETLIYLNPRILMQPDHRLECSLAMEIALYVVKKEKREGDEHRLQELLVGWGFEREVKEVCFCDAVAGSKVFKTGYEWARKQSEDYLKLHFGLYFDEWNAKGLARMPEDRVEMLRSHVSQDRLLPGAAGREEKELPEGISPDQVLIEGIMAAIKEIKMREPRKD
ncbi:MAG: hypothetical protein EHM75_11385 [Desulfobacteraceae bacterium]|nr:MAG: hypothetical protein EHM75_11385 [Desulfobacteraceae bacterium]